MLKYAEVYLLQILEKNLATRCLRTQQMQRSRTWKCLSITNGWFMAASRFSYMF